MDLDGLTITKLERDAKDGFWKCNVSINGGTSAVHCKYGSWQLDRKDGTTGCVFPAIAERIQVKVKTLEKQERKQ